MAHNPIFTADELRQMRGACDLSQRDVAKRIHCSRRAWQRWEAGEKPIPPDAAQQLVALLHTIHAERAQIRATLRHDAAQVIPWLSAA